MDDHELEPDLVDLVLRAHDLLGEGVIIGDAQRLLFANQAACTIYGRTLEELRRRGTVFDLLAADEQARITQLIGDLMAAGQPVPDRHETSIERPDGTLVAVELALTAVVKGDRVRTLAIVRDMSARRAATDELERLALHDALTGLPNRRLLLERIGQAMARAQREPRPSALLFIDLDRFKPINDRHGHLAGDEVLRTVAERLTGIIRPGDTVARLGGDEFVVLADAVRAVSTVGILTGRILEALEAPIPIGDDAVEVSASVGVHTFGTAGEDDPVAALQLADAAMYRAKARR